MPQAIKSIVIKGDLDQIFSITNDIDRWSELFIEYKHSKILKKENYGRFTRLEFEWSKPEGQTWQSWRMLDHQKHVAFAQREKPMFPYKYMYLTWKYEQVEDGVLMTWTHDFEMDSNAPKTNEEALELMIRHMEEKQKHFKEALEAEFARIDMGN
jgi:aromatase